MEVFTLIEMIHRQTGERKFVKPGFSWTTFFFGFFVPLFRGDILWAIIMVATSFMTFGFGWIIFPFFYNKVYINKLQNKGFAFATSFQGNSGSNVNMNANPTINVNIGNTVDHTNQPSPVTAATTTPVEPIVANSTLIDKPTTNQLNSEPAAQVIAQVDPTVAIEEPSNQENIKQLN